LCLAVCHAVKKARGVNMSAVTLRLNRPFLRVAFRVWLTEIRISGFNYSFS
jgi:hypothetical protein